ncbi:MAG: papain-like cysteine protease family protein [Bdellovibrionota bacterium]
MTPAIGRECNLFDLIQWQLYRLLDDQRKPSIRLPEGGVVRLGPNRFRAGIPDNHLEFFAAPETAGRQRQSNWCWAASTQMVLNYHGIRVAQEEVVERIFGELVDRTAGHNEILTALNHWFPSLNGGAARPIARSFPVIQDGRFVYELANGNPMIVGLKGSANGAPGHAYVLTGAEVSVDKQGLPRFIHSMTLRDPWPTNASEITIPWEEFESRYMMGFSVRVLRP